ncbi:hypothetical protein Esi_0037_0114 [Ectocarpus siliculosus]|uniref:Uncharacterized protein n=1 Tax=Ectocarpus siliculosus TaxID=2880 RepID=D8LLQ8_ECTSI|nr:hypothetical protein Esi_0037_0114 [Ectocarpus siliculosus]|eukprot:CBN74689.1 hypothetical protein Esi_0037_0114 [Ectocarpus siliculosus]
MGGCQHHAFPCPVQGHPLGGATPPLPLVQRHPKPARDRPRLLGVGGDQQRRTGRRL